MVLRFLICTALVAGSLPALAQTSPQAAPKPKPAASPRPVKSPPSLTAGAFAIDRNEIADARWRRNREESEVKLGEGLLTNTMRWRFGKEDPKPESISPDPHFNRGDE